MNERDLAGRTHVAGYTRRQAKPRGPALEQTKLRTSAALAVDNEQPDAETYARALVPVVRRYCGRPLEVARWLVRIFEETGEP